MQGIIKGFAMYHTGVYFKDDDKETKANPLPWQSLTILERDEKKCPGARKIKVASNHAGPAASLDNQHVEVLVDLVETNYNGRESKDFHFVKGKVAAVSVAA